MQESYIDYEAGISDDVLGGECIGCHCLWTWESRMFNKNSAYRTGYEPMCIRCQSSPKLSMNEHIARLREENLSSYGTQRQRHPDQAELKGQRQGRSMDCSLFLQKLLHLCPALYVTQGGLRGDLALYVTSGSARPEWNGNTFSYLGYCTVGAMPEFSSYEFDTNRDILLRVKDIGWRSVLLRFIENGILTEKQVNQEFGPPSGGVNSLWYKKLHQQRHKKAA